VSSSRRRYEEYRERLARELSDAKREGTAVMRAGTTVSLRRSRSFAVLLREFLRLLGASRAGFVVALLTLTVSTAFALVPPAATKFVIDNVFDRRPLPEWLRQSFPDSWSWLGTPEGLLNALAIGILVSSILSIAVGIGGRYQATRTVKRMQSSLRRTVFDHAARLPLHRVQRMKAGGMASMLREDTGAVGDLVFSMVYNPWRAIVQLAGSLTILALTDWRLLLGSLLLLPMVWYTHRTWVGRVRPVFRDIRRQRDAVDGHAAEVFGGIRVVRGFVRTAAESGRNLQSSHVMIRQEMLAWWWSRSIELVWAVVLPLASALLLWYGGRQVLAGSITPGDLILFLAYLAMLLGPMEALTNSATNIQSGLAAMDRILDLCAEPEELPDGPDSRSVGPASVRGAIRGTGISYTYPGSAAPAVHGLSFDIPAGTMTALVGPSGSGKTTLCNLVARFYDPSSGAIQLDGTDLRSIRLHDFRQLLSIVEQDTFLFDGTIGENIRYGAPHASPAQLASALEAAGLSAFVATLPEGLETVIGERGVRLSGGQRQRLAIARAILSDGRILILDEATSSLDSESEAHIQRSLFRLMEHRTSLVIAHRLSTIQHADQILVLENGTIIERGTHAQLIASSGRYASMVLLQTQPPPRRVPGNTTIAPDDADLQLVPQDP